MAQPLTIGRLAQRVGVGVPTVRFYEREGLLAQPKRPPRGYRVYPADAVARLRFVQRAKNLGFTLKEIRELLALRARRGEPCETVRECARAKLRDVEARLRELAVLRASLQRLIATCSAEGSVDDCSILAGLADTEENPWNSKKRVRAASPRVKPASRSA
jgi:MerR family copper efflux transcriptional regulator